MLTMTMRERMHLKLYGWIYNDKQEKYYIDCKRHGYTEAFKHGNNKLTCVDCFIEDIITFNYNGRGGELEEWVDIVNKPQ